MSADTRVRVFAARVRPVVLVGGKSRRFGRDKLMQPVARSEHDDDTLLVDRPLEALRTVFGARVEAVGACDPRVAVRFDAIIADRYPGAGPMGAIVSALESAGGPVFVLAGDMPEITPQSVRLIVERAAELDAAGDDAIAVLASAPADVHGGEIEPCCGLYFPAAADPLRPRHASLDKAESLRRRLSRLAVVRVPVHARELVNVNRPEDLPRQSGQDVPPPLGHGLPGPPREP